MEPEDGLVTAEELRQVLLAVFSNCTYRVQRATDKLWCELPLNSSLVGSSATVPRVCFNATQGECRSLTPEKVHPGKQVSMTALHNTVSAVTCTTSARSSINISLMF
jgi:hypothetical protein